MSNDEYRRAIKEILLAIYLTVLGIAVIGVGVLFGFGIAVGFGILLAIVGIILALVGFTRDWSTKPTG